jgi:hypothetical protein
MYKSDEDSMSDNVNLINLTILEICIVTWCRGKGGNCPEKFLFLLYFLLILEYCTQYIYYIFFSVYLPPTCKLSHNHTKLFYCCCCCSSSLSCTKRSTIIQSSNTVSINLHRLIDIDSE